MKPVDVTTRVRIAVPVSVVAAYASDPDNAPEWYVNIKSVEWLSTPPLATGSQVRFKARFMGRELAYVYEVAEWVPDRKLVMRTSDGPFPMQTTYSWELTEDDHTLMTLRNAGLPSGFSRLMAPFIRFAMRKANQKDLELLKSILEKRARD
jgi:hypothetical protein